MRGHSNVQGDRTVGINHKPSPIFIDSLEISTGIRSPEKHGFDSVEAVKAMEKGIDLAKANATNTLDEIAYLRKQLVIGQSTLDSVLSAEARLYDAESKEINFMADKHLAELTILSATGLLSDLLSLD